LQYVGAYIKLLLHHVNQAFVISWDQLIYAFVEKDHRRQAC